MVGWHHQFSGHEFEQILGYSEGQGSLGILQSMRLQRVGRNLVNEQQQQTLFQCSVRPAHFGVVCL